MKTRADAVKTIRGLLEDLQNDPSSWENPTLERYLEAMAAWIEDSGEKYNQPPSWELIVDIVKAAKIYE